MEIFPRVLNEMLTSWFWTLSDQDPLLNQLVAHNIL